MVYCMLGTLPVELVHHLLKYFSAYEIFNTFSNVSSYIDNVLLTYSNYCVNFKSVTKKEFDFVCQRIKPDQIIQLTLSDDERTPGQVELFLSRFQINQFINLRSLTLVEVGSDFWELIITKLIDLKNLRSFFYDSSNRTDTWINKLSYDDIVVLDKQLFNSYSSVLPQLNRLKLSHGDFFRSVQFPYLRHLILKDCKVDILKHLCSAAPQLKSLQIEIQYNESCTEFCFPFNQLNRLVLRIDGLPVSMHNMEQLMAKLPSLKYLELRVNGDVDLLNGQRWQTIMSRLITFNFLFSLTLDVDVPDLDSFRTSFWLIEKQWFVAYAYGFLMSVPHFADTEVNETFEAPALTTLPDKTIFYKHITHLILTKSLVTANYHFTQIQTLTLGNYIDLPAIERIVDLNRIQHLILYSQTICSRLVFLIRQMPNLYRISIRCNIRSHLQQLSGESFEKIRSLEIGNPNLGDDINNDNDNYDIEQLSIIFPSVQHLRVDYWCSKLQIFHFINQFKHLSTASFLYSYWFFDAQETLEHSAEIRLALNQNRSLHQLDYTYRFDRESVHIWL